MRSSLTTLSRTRPDLNVRHRHPVLIGQEIQITAHAGTNTGPLRLLSTEIAKNGVICVVAHAKFMQVSSLTPIS